MNTNNCELLFESGTSVTVWTAADCCALDGVAGLVHAPAEAGGVPALHGLVAALLIALRLVCSNLTHSRRCLCLAFGLDQRGCPSNEKLKIAFTIESWGN